MEVVVLVFRTIRDLKGSLKVGSNHSQWQRVVVFGVLVDTMPTHRTNGRSASRIIENFRTGRSSPMTVRKEEVGTRPASLERRPRIVKWHRSGRLEGVRSKCVAFSKSIRTNDETPNTDLDQEANATPLRIQAIEVQVEERNYPLDLAGVVEERNYPLDLAGVVNGNALPPRLTEVQVEERNYPLDLAGVVNGNALPPRLTKSSPGRGTELSSRPGRGGKRQCPAAPTCEKIVPGRGIKREQYELKAKAA
ncbi:hypothetical protein V8G54_037251 [Vigna mungo]|uniref:Uncharacterized protein n=1 Tax=Vigna mungo TaxID=3915 RepID=A0AAQ3RGB8_VIGMU